MLKNKLAGLEVRLESLADKLEFEQEHVFVQLLELKEDIHKARIVIDATQG